MRSTRVSYGWYVVATLCITETVTWGIVWLTAALLVVSVADTKVHSDA